MKYCEYIDPDLGAGEIHATRYPNNGNIELSCKSPSGNAWRTLTVNFDRLGTYQIALDHRNQSEKPLTILLEAGVIEHSIVEGHVKTNGIQYPVHNLSREFRGWLEKVGKL